MRIWNRMLRWPFLRSTLRKLLPVRVRCRAATLADERGVARLMEPLFPPAARGEALPSAQRLLSETLRCGGEYRIAEADPFILGGCQVGPLLQSAGFEGRWILGLWVHPSARGRGIGETLIGDVLRAERERGETRLFCHIADTNVASTQLFTKLGFRPAPPELQAQIHEKFGSAFDDSAEIRAYSIDLTVSLP